MSTLHGATRRSWIWGLALLFLVGPTLAAPPVEAGDGWADRLRRAGGRARGAMERTQDAIRRHAPEVKRRAHSGAQRVRKETQRATDAIRRNAPVIKQRAQETWRRVEPTVRQGARRFREEVVPRAREFGQATQRRLQDLSRHVTPERMASLRRDVEGAIRHYGPLAQDRMVSFYEHGREHLLPRAKAIMEGCRGAVGKTLGDPAFRARAMDGVLTAIDVYDRVDRMKDEAVRTGLDVLGNQIPIQVNGEWTTLNQAAGGMLTDACPYFEGTTIAKEPIQAVACVMVFREPSYIVNELRVLKDDRGNAMSVGEALEDAAGTDADRIVDLLDVASGAMELRSSLRSGEGVLGAATGFATSVRRYGDGPRRAAVTVVGHSREQ